MTWSDRWRGLWSRGWIRRPIKIFVVPLLVLFLLIELVDGVVMPRITRHGQEFPSPRLVGHSLEEAQEIVRAAGAAMQIAERRYSPDYPDGTIIDQRPAVNAPIKRGRTFRVVVSRGSELVSVPRVRGFTVRQAELILTEAGFVIGQHAASPDSSVPLGTVVGTIPGAGARLLKGAPVNLLINRQPREDYAWCPNLVGMNIEEARDLLRSRGLLLGEVERRFDSSQMAGTILEQSAAPGDEIALGTEVNLVIAWGE